MASIGAERRLVLSSDEVRQLTRWPEAMIVDYQGILQDIIDLSQQVDDQDNTIEEQVALIQSQIAVVASREAAAINKINRKAKNLEQLLYAW